MISLVGTYHSHALDLGGLASGASSLGRLLHRVAELLDPWPGYAVTADELLVMLAAERQGKERSRPLWIGLDELLERHRRLGTAPARTPLSGEWRV